MPEEPTSASVVAQAPGDQPATGALESKERALGYAALAVSTVGVGSAVVFVRLSEVDATATLMLRMILASALLGGAAALPGREMGRGSTWSPRDLGLLLLSSVVSGLDLLANHWSVHHTAVANTALLMNLSPVFVLLLSWLVFRQTISSQRTLAVTVALAGGAIVVLGSGEAVSLGRGHLLGDGLAVLSAMLYAVYLLITKSLRSRLTTPVIMFANATVIGVMLLPVALTTSSQVLPRGFGGYAIILGLVLVSQFLGHGFMAYSLRVLDAGVASLSALLRPVVAVVFGWLILGEGLGLVQMAGGAIVLAGLGWFQHLGRQQ